MRLDQTSVLIVDDLSDMREIINATLMTLPVKTIFEAEDGLEALALLEQHTINCVISDWRMPRLDGLGLLTALRSDPHYLGVSFMMMTGDVSRDNIQEAISMGVDAFLAKPFSTTALMEKMALIAEKAYTPTEPFQFQNRLTDPGKATETLLLVSDSEAFCRNISEKLQESYQISMANDGIAALQMSRIEPFPELILIDDQVSEMDYLTLCQNLSSDPITSHIPIIVLGDQMDDEKVVSGLKAGAADYLAKQSSADLIKIKINNSLNAWHDRDKKAQQVKFLMKQVMGLPKK